MTDPRQGRPSASQIEQRWLCPGSANAQRGLPEVATDVSDDGTKIHAALAGESDPTSLSQVNRTVYDEMNEKLAKSAEMFGFDPLKFKAEKRLWFFDEFSGQPDRVYLRDGMAYLPDVKSGFLPVTPAPTNPQLATLAILAIHNYGVARVAVAIIPRFGKVKETAEYTPESAMGALTFIRQIIADSEKPDAPRKAGDKQCRYCLAKTRCPEYLAFTSVALTVRENSLPAMPAEQLASICDKLSAVDGLVKSIKAEAKKRIADGDPEFMKLYGLTDGRKTRTIVNLVELFARVRSLGVSDEDFTAACSLELGSLEKLVGQATMLTGKALEKKCEALLAGLVDVGRTAGSLKRKDAA